MKTIGMLAAGLLVMALSATRRLSTRSSRMARSSARALISVKPALL